MKTFIDFGVIKKKKKIYQTLNGDLYDTYMLSRYFNDIYNLNKIINKKIEFQKKLLHDTKDLRFNLINFLLLLENKKKRFYEFGFTLYEKIFYFRLFNKLSSQKINLKKQFFSGNEISDQFIFFSENFYKNLKINLSKKIEKKNYSKSVFFSKGVTLLYEKNNMNYLNNFIKECETGSFDISLYPQKKRKLLETGYNLYYPSIKEFKKILEKSNKYFFYRNKKKIGNKLYLEVLFGNRNLGKRINNKLAYFSKSKKIKILSRYLCLNKKFRELNTRSF
jgi:hypothetical protein